MHVGSWVTDLAAISCLGAGLAALVLTLIPGKKLTGKSDGVDPSSFIDPGAGETARYRLAYKDLVTVKNTAPDATQVSPQMIEASELNQPGSEPTRAQSASDLALTMFDRGVLGDGLGERSQAATKQLSKTGVEKSKSDKTRVENKKVENKTKVESKPKPAAKTKGKADSKKGGEKPKIETNMAVRRVTYGSKAQKEHEMPGETQPPIEEVQFPSAQPLPGQFFPQVSSEQEPPVLPTVDAPVEPPKDSSKDPRKVGRSTLIEPKSNLQGSQPPPPDDRDQPPLEYFK